MSVRELLRAEMADRLNSGTAVEIGWENQKFEEPPQELFLKCFFRYSSSRRATIGTEKRFNRHEGFFIILAHAPEDKGTKALFELVDDVVAIFEAKNFKLSDCSNVTLGVPQSFSNGKVQDAKYIMTVMVPFCVDAKGTI